MGRLTWHDIRQQLRQQDSVPPPPPATEFWTRFRARARQRLRPEPTPVRQRARPWAHPLPRLAWAAALLILTGLAVLLLQRDPTPGSGPLVAVAGRANASAIEEIEVFVPYSSMMIMQDAETGSAIVWLADLDVSAKL